MIITLYILIETRYKKVWIFQGIADQTVDIAAILGTYETEDPEELKFIDNMNDMFFNFVNTGKLPKDQDLTKGMYIVDSEIKTQGSYPNCDFWKKAQQIVPTYAALDWKKSWSQLLFLFLFPLPPTFPYWWLYYCYCLLLRINFTTLLLLYYTAPILYIHYYMCRYVMIT